MYLLSLLTTLLGSHAILSSALTQSNCYGNPSTVGYCTPLTYKDTTDDFSAPPTTIDCDSTCIGINEDAGDWLVDFSTDADGARHSMILYHCGFAVSRGESTSQDAKFSMANQDILDLYEESLNQFGSLHNGSISAEGTMVCEDLEVNWYIQDLNV
ncbi:hypothetical protein F5Y08DRAFT_252716 [Xylaria arbuscula]|nr:hypothetical protein F5Y08DRAFT_252716 [Xylaria arbuscula]